jgi:ankyrin repeat protein
METKACARGAGFAGRNELSKELYAAVTANDVNVVRLLLVQRPELLDRGLLSTTCLNYASKYCNLEMINSFWRSGSLSTHPTRLGVLPLSLHCVLGRIEFARHLLDRGADVGIGRPLIGAFVCDDLQMVKLVVEHGVDVNDLFLWFNNPTDQFSALSFALERGANQEIIDFLRSQGAKTTEEIQNG